MGGFLANECDDDLAARVRREVRDSHGVGYGCFELNTVDVELLYGEKRAKATDVAGLGDDDVELTIEDFLSVLPDVPPGARMHARPRRVIVLPSPEN
jgi:hypothetical protein